MTADKQKPRLTIVAIELPYPPIHGARVDIWRRLKALDRLHVPVQYLCWSRTPPDADVEAAIRHHTTDFAWMPYPSGLLGWGRRGVDLLSYPIGVTSRFLRGPVLSEQIARVTAFAPDVVMADHVHCAIAAWPLAESVDKPMIVRSHDIGHLHYRELMRQGMTPQAKLRAFLSWMHMEAYETSMLRRALAFFDISASDLDYWRSQGLTNGFFLPPLIEQDDLTRGDAGGQPEFDAVFLGNLNTPNNVAGVLWLVREVAPLLRQRHPDFSVAIAGSAPTPAVIEACNSAPGITLLANPPDAAAVYRSGRVCVDPVAVGTGVSLKSLDMLVAGRPIVSFRKGTNGLPQSLKQHFRLATDAPSFAAAIFDVLEQDVRAPSLELLMSELGDGVIARFVDQLSDLLELRDTAPVD